MAHDVPNTGTVTVQHVVFTRTVFVIDNLIVCLLLWMFVIIVTATNSASITGAGRVGGIIRMCVSNSHFFQHCQVYNWPPFFNKKYMNGLIFLDSYVKGPIFSDILVCRPEIFRERA